MVNIKLKHIPMIISLASILPIILLGLLFEKISNITLLKIRDYKK